MTTDLKRTAGVFIETAWAGAAYYLLWFMLAGHVSASIGSVLSIIFSTFLTHQKQAAVMRSIFDYNISDIVRGVKGLLGLSPLELISRLLRGQVRPLYIMRGDVSI